MKILKQIALSLIAVAALTSCSMTSKTVTVDEDFISKNGFMMAKPQVVDIKVEKRKIEGRAIIKNKLYGAENVMNAAKKLAVIDAIKKGNADIIVQPIFKVESDATYTTATVVGFAGMYTNFRDVTPADATAFKMRKLLDSYSSDVAAPTEKTVTGNKKGN
jgi:hypothetical protein